MVLLPLHGTTSATTYYHCSYSSTLLQVSSKVEIHIWGTFIHWIFMHWRSCQTRWRVILLYICITIQADTSDCRCRTVIFISEFTVFLEPVDRLEFSPSRVSTEQKKKPHPVHHVDLKAGKKDRLMFFQTSAVAFSYSTQHHTYSECELYMHIGAVFGPGECLCMRLYPCPIIIPHEATEQILI